MERLTNFICAVILGNNFQSFIFVNEIIQIINPKLLFNYVTRSMLLVEQLLVKK